MVRRLPKFEEWESGTRQPTLKQLEAFARLTHAPIGYLFLPSAPWETVPIPDFRTVADGGYPDRLSGDAIPLGARILAGWNFDALTSDRPYRRRLSDGDAGRPGGGSTCSPAYRRSMRSRSRCARRPVKTSRLWLVSGRPDVWGCAPRPR